VNRRTLIALLRDESGVALSEYALVLAILAIIMIAAFSLVNVAAGRQYDTTSTGFTQQGRTPP